VLNCADKSQSKVINPENNIEYSTARGFMRRLPIKVETIGISNIGVAIDPKSCQTSTTESKNMTSIIVKKAEINIPSLV